MYGGVQTKIQRAHARSMRKHRIDDRQSDGSTIVSPILKNKGGVFSNTARLNRLLASSLLSSFRESIWRCACCSARNRLLQLPKVPIRCLAAASEGYQILRK